MSSKKSKWHVRLGEAEWIRYTYARTENDGLRLLGSVRRGAQVGALGVTEQGDYVQVVGDYVIPLLNRQQIAKAIPVATIGAHRVARPVQQKAAAPVIVVKRRRVLVPA